MQTAQIVSQGHQGPLQRGSRLAAQPETLAPVERALTLFELAQQDERVVFITGDLGYRVVEKFMEQRPRQFLNAGVAEQNMTGLAAG